MLHNAGTTQTSPFTSLPLTAQQDKILVQQLRLGGDGRSLTGIEATLDCSTNKHVIFYQDIESQLLKGQKVAWIARKRTHGTTAMISPLRDENTNQILEPRRVIYSREMMEVHLTPQNEFAAASGLTNDLVQEYDILLAAKALAREQMDIPLQSECAQAMAQRFTALLHAAEVIDANHAESFASSQTFKDHLEKLHIAALNIQDSINYTVPRRFYVMYRERSHIGRIFIKPMRLFLVCECSLHRFEAMPDTEYNPEGPDTPLDGWSKKEEDDAYTTDMPLVHLSNHRGYSINTPTKLCKDFGTYLLPLLTYLKYTAVTAGIVIPALAPLNIPAWISDLQSTVNYNNQSLSEVWQRTIDFVSEHTTMDGCEVLNSRGEVERDDVLTSHVFEPLIGEQYMMFKELLGRIDKSGILGNLRKTFGPKGGVIWVCKDHDGENNKREHFWLDLTALESKVEGKVSQCQGDVKFTIQKDYRKMGPFYEALSKAPGVRSVTVCTGPDMDVNNLKMLRDQLTMANVRNLVLDGSHLKSISPWDKKLPQEWLCILLEIIFNERRHVVRVTGMENFFANLPRPKLQPTRFLEVLELDFDFDLDKHQDKLLFFLSFCPSVKILKLRSTLKMKLLDYIRQSKKPNRLLLLQMAGPDYVLLVRSPLDAIRSTYEIQATDKKFISLDTAMEGKVSILRLQLTSYPSDQFQQRLRNFLFENQDLRIIDITASLSSFDLLRDIFTSTQACGSGISDCYIQLGTPRKDYDGHKVEMRFRCKGSTITTISTDVEMTGTNIDNDQLEDIICSYSPTIRSLAGNARLDSAFVDLFVDCCRNQNRTCQLERLIVDPSRFVESADLAKLVDMSKNMKDLRFCCSASALADPLLRERVISMLDQFGEIVTGLVLSCNSLSDIAYSSMTTVSGKDYLASTCILPSCQKTLNMTELSLSFEKITSLATNQGHDRVLMEWIVNSISRSPNSSSLSQSLVKPLASLALCSVELSAKNWDRVLGAIDWRTMERLSFEKTNFEADQMRTLIRRYPRPSVNTYQEANRTIPPLMELVIIGTPLARTENRMALARLETRMLQRVRDVRIVITDEDEGI